MPIKAEDAALIRSLTEEYYIQDPQQSCLVDVRKSWCKELKLSTGVIGGCSAYIRYEETRARRDFAGARNLPDAVLPSVARAVRWCSNPNDQLELLEEFSIRYDIPIQALAAATDQYNRNLGRKEGGIARIEDALKSSLARGSRTETQMSCDENVTREDIPSDCPIQLLGEPKSDRIKADDTVTTAKLGDICQENGDFALAGSELFGSGQLSSLSVAYLVNAESNPVTGIRGDEADYDFPAKRRSRECHLQEIQKTFTPQQLPYVKVLCLPGAKVWDEINGYLRIGIRAENIFAVEGGGPSARAQFTENARAAGIQYRVGMLQQILPTLDVIFDIVALDFHGFPSDTHDQILSQLRLADKALLIYNAMAKRERKDFQRGMFYSYLSFGADDWHEIMDVKSIRPATVRPRADTEIPELQGLDPNWKRDYERQIESYRLVGNIFKAEALKGFLKRLEAKHQIKMEYLQAGAATILEEERAKGLAGLRLLTSYCQQRFRAEEESEEPSDFDFGKPRMSLQEMRDDLFVRALCGSVGTSRFPRCDDYKSIAATLFEMVEPDDVDSEFPDFLLKATVAWNFHQLVMSFKTSQCSHPKQSILKNVDRDLISLLVLPPLFGQPILGPTRLIGYHSGVSGASSPFNTTMAVLYKPDYLSKAFPEISDFFLELLKRNSHCFLALRDRELVPPPLTWKDEILIRSNGIPDFKISAGSLNLQTNLLASQCKQLRLGQKKFAEREWID